MGNNNDIIMIQPQHRDRAQAVIARAFENDPFTRHLSMNAGLQARMLQWFAGTGIKYGERRGQVFVTPGVDGVAVWFGPDSPAAATASMWRAALLLSLYAGCRVFRKFLNLARYAEEVHQGIITGDHYYLFILAVAPDHQGQGLGGQLLQPVLARADAGQMACYLETTNPRAPRFYEQHGFQVMHQGQLQPEGLNLWSLLRQPGKSQGDE